MHPSIRVRTLLAAAALLAAGPAGALSTTTSTLSGFQFRVTDLDPSDGVAPSFALDPQARSHVVPDVASTFSDTSWPRQGDSAFGAVASGGQLGGSGAAASFSGDPFGAGATIAASAQGDSPLDVAAAAAYVQSDSGQNVLVLGAHTGVTFGGDVTIAWNADSPAASAFGEVDLSFFTAPGSDVFVDIQHYVTGGYYGGSGGGALAGSTTSTNFVWYENDSDTPVALAYEVFVYANASDLEMSLPPVDEPGGGLMLLAGASLLWGLRRLRRGRSA